MAPITFPRPPGFNDLPDSVLSAGQYAIGRHIAAIKGNADFGMVYPEFFQTVQVHGDTVPLPVSGVDGYAYSREELVYVWSVQTSASQKSGWESGPGSLWFAQWFVQQWNDTPGADNSGAGKVTSEEYYRTSGHDNGKSNDGVLLVTTVGIRRRAALTMAQVARPFVDMDNSLFATDQPYAETRLKNLSNDAKFAIVNSEVIYMGQYGNGDVVLPPVSPVDGYAYSYAEVVQFVYSWVWTTPRSGFATPTRANGKPQNQLGRLEANVGATGNVSTSVIYYDSGEIPTNDGLLAVFAFCQRSFCTCTAADFGTGLDGPVVFDGINPVTHATLGGGVYALTGDINASSITVDSGVEVRTANYKLLCTGAVSIAGHVHNDGFDAGGGFCWAQGFPGQHTTNYNSAGTLLLVAPMSASSGDCDGANNIPAGGAGGPSLAGSGYLPGGAGGAGGAGGSATGSNCGSSINFGGPGGSGAEGGGGGGGAGGSCAIGGGEGGGGSGGGQGGSGGPVYIAGDSITIQVGGSVTSKGGKGGDGQQGANAVPGSAAAGGGGGGGGGGGAGSTIDFYCASFINNGLLDVSGGAAGAAGGGGAGASDGFGGVGGVGHPGQIGISGADGSVELHYCCNGTGALPINATEYAWFDEILLSHCLPARADLVLQILKNAREAALRPEFFNAGVFTNGDTVPLPTGADGYAYSRDECCYIPMLADTGAETSGNIRICTFSANVDPTTGAVTTERVALLDGGTKINPVHTLTVRVLTVAIRSAAAPAPPSSGGGGSGPAGGGGDSGGGGDTFHDPSQTVADEWTEVNDSGTYGYSQQPAFSGSGSIQGISVNNTSPTSSAGILGRRKACAPGDLLLWMFRAKASVAISSGFSYSLVFYSADLSQTAVLPISSGALGSSVEQHELVLKVPASSDTSIWTDLGVISDPSGLGFTPAFAAVEFDVIAPSATTTVSIGDVIFRTVDDARTLQRQAYEYAEDTGAADAYVVALPVAPSRIDGALLVVKIAHDNTGASTLDDGSGTLPILNPDGSALAAGALKAGSIYPLVYNSNLGSPLAPCWQLAGGGGSFTPGGDLSGTSTSQEVIGILNKLINISSLDASKDGVMFQYSNTTGKIEGVWVYKNLQGAVAGTPSAGQPLGYLDCTQAVAFAADFGYGSSGGASGGIDPRIGTIPASDVVCPIYKITSAGVATQIGTMTVLSATGRCSFATTSHAVQSGAETDKIVVYNANPAVSMSYLSFSIPGFLGSTAPTFPSGTLTGAVLWPASFGANNIIVADPDLVHGKDSGVSISTDGTMAANSDSLVPTQKAAKTYADSVGLPWQKQLGDPTAVSFSWRNQGGASVTARTRSIFLSVPAGAGDNIRGREIAVPSTSADWSITASFAPQMHVIASQYGGLYVTDNTKLITMMFSQNAVVASVNLPSVQSAKYTNVTTFSANTTATSIVNVWPQSLIYLKIWYQNSGPTLHFYWSINGYDFEEVANIGAGAFLGTMTNVGFMASATNATWGAGLLLTGWTQGTN